LNIEKVKRIIKENKSAMVRMNAVVKWGELGKNERGMVRGERVEWRVLNRCESEYEWLGQVRVIERDWGEDGRSK
jgi:hypothetical protein